MNILVISLLFQGYINQLARLSYAYHFHLLILPKHCHPVR